MHRSMMMHNSAIPASEMEAFLQHLRKLYEVALQLGNENAIQLMNEIHYANEQKFKHQASEVAQNVNQPSAQTIIQPVPSTVQNPVAQISEPVVTVNEIPETPVSVQQQVSESNTQTQTRQPIAAIDNHPVNEVRQTVAGKFTESPTIGDKIAGTEQKRFSDNIKLPVKDINAAIGINEKFQFINQLFHGDSQKYTQFVSELNSCASADLAKQSIKQIAVANHWDTIPVAKHFMEVVERRFV